MPMFAIAAAVLVLILPAAARNADLLQREGAGGWPGDDARQHDDVLERARAERRPRRAPSRRHDELL
jgi:hypothetical protein